MADLAPASSPPTGRRATTALFVTVLLDLVGFGMILPLLPFYALDLGAGEAAVGVLFASFSAAQFVAAPILGRISDRVGRRPVILGSIAGAVVAYLAFAAAPSFAWLLAARIGAGIAAGNLGIAQAYVADVTTPADRSRGMGMIGAAFGLGFVAGPALGGVAGLAGHVAVPLAAAGLAAINLGLAWAWLPESLPADRRLEAARERAAGPGFLARVRGRHDLVGLLVLFFVTTFAFSLMEATLALYCRTRFGFGQVETTWLFVLVGVVIVAVQGGLIGRLAPRFGERRLVLGGLAMMAAGLLAFPVAPGVAAAAGVLILLSLGNGVFNPSFAGLLSQRAGDRAQGGTLGLSRSAGSLGRVFGPPTGTWLFAEFGPGWPFWAGGALMAVALVAGLALVLPRGAAATVAAEGSAPPT